jgi:hypothetical protein
MSSEATWQRIEDKLSQLLEEDRYARFHPLVQKLKQWSSARSYPPQIFEGFIEIVSRMQDELDEGRSSIQDVLDQTLTGTFIQPDWDVNSVFQTNGHIFQFVLGNFRKEIESEIATPNIHVPIVLLVMNAVEADDLMNGTLLDASPDEIKTDFESLQSHLRGHGAADWIERYKTTPQEWQPFSGAEGAESIEELIIQTLRSITGYESAFVPLFIDIRTLNEERNRLALRELRQEGCVVIIDSISMRHPIIHREFYQSSLDAYPNTSVVSIAPMNSAFDVLREMNLIIQMRIADMEFTKRMYDDEDYGTCEELCEERRFKHWLADRVKKLTRHQAAPQKSIRSYMHKLENS